MDAGLILQAHLDQMTDCVMRADFAGYRTGFALPLHIITTTANLTVQTDEDLRLGFEEFAMMLRIQRVTDCIRLVISAQLLDPQLIQGSYETHLLSGGTRILLPVTSQTVMRRSVDAIWRTVSIANGVAGRISSAAWVKEIPPQGDMS
jgi:hypothetical protein